MTWHMLLTHYCPNFHLAQRIIFAEVQLQRLSSNLFVYSSLSANHTWLFSMQITAFGSAQSGKHSLFFLHAPCLRSARDDRCVNIWKIAHKNLHKSAWFADKKMNFAIQSVFISTYAIISNSQFSVSDIPAPKAFNHGSLTAILLTESDPSWHRGFIMTARWYMLARSHSFTASKPHCWPLQHHVDCDGWKTEPGYPWISALQGASVRTDGCHYLLASQPDDYKETLNSAL